MSGRGSSSLQVEWQREFESANACNPNEIWHAGLLCVFMALLCEYVDLLCEYMALLCEHKCRSANASTPNEICVCVVSKKEVMAQSSMQTLVYSTQIDVRIAFSDTLVYLLSSLPSFACNPNEFWCFPCKLNMRETRKRGLQRRIEGNTHIDLNRLRRHTPNRCGVCLLSLCASIHRMCVLP